MGAECLFGHYTDCSVDSRVTTRDQGGWGVAAQLSHAHVYYVTYKSRTPTQTTVKRGDNTRINVGVNKKL